jgi:hypothetical protein
MIDTTRDRDLFQVGNYLLTKGTPRDRDKFHTSRLMIDSRYHDVST